MTRKPFGGGVPSPATGPRPVDTTAFIAGAPGKGTLPWHQPIRPDAKTYVNTAQPERLMLQVDWLSYHSGRTKREIIEAALRAYLPDQIIALGADPTLPED